MRRPYIDLHLPFSPRGALALALGAATLVACKSRSEDGSGTAGLIANSIVTDGKNVAVLSNSAPIDQSRLHYDEVAESGNGSTVVHNLEAILEAPPFSMQTYDVIDAPKAALVLERLVEAAQEAGSEGTLVWFHHGLGAERGELLFPEGYESIHFMRVAQELSGALRGRLLRRFVIFLDSDFSGRWLSQGEGVFAGWFPKVAREIVVLASTARESASHSPYFSFALAEQLKAATAVAPPPSIRVVFNAVTTAVRERVANEKLRNQEPQFGASPGGVLDLPFLGESGAVAVGGPEFAMKEDEWVYQCRGEVRTGVAASDPDPWEPYGWRWAYVGRATLLPATFLECKGWSRFTNSCSSVIDASGAEVPCDKSTVGKLAFTNT